MAHPVDDAGAQARRRALERLSRRDHSEQEIGRSLLRDGFTPETAQATVERLKQQRYLDDDRFAARFAGRRIGRAGMGRHRVRAELEQRGVSRAIIERGLKQALAEFSEAEAVDALARRYWRDRARDEPARRIRKLWAFLRRRGFPASLVHARLDALWPRWRGALEGLEPETDE